MATTKPRNPQDATWRNVRASRKADASLLARLKRLEHRIHDLEQVVLARHA